MKYLAFLAMMLLAGCASAIPPPARPAAQGERPAAALPARPVINTRGLEAVMGKDIATLKRLFGEPRLDVVEVQGRKLQWTGKACVLDAYFYPDGKGGSEIVTHVDARRNDGAAVDRTSCVDALQRR